MLGHFFQYANLTGNHPSKVGRNSRWKQLHPNSWLGSPVANGILGNLSFYINHSKHIWRKYYGRQTRTSIPKHPIYGILYPHVVNLSGKRRWIYDIFIHIQRLGCWFQTLWSPNQPAINGFLQIPSMGLANSSLVGGFNPFEKYSSKWESSPTRGENKKYLKPPPLSTFTCYLLCMENVPSLSKTSSTDQSVALFGLHIILPQAPLLTTGSGLGEWLHFISSSTLSPILLNVTIILETMPPPDRQASTKLRHGYFVELPWRCRGFGLRVRRSKSRIFISSRFMKAA